MSVLAAAALITAFVSLIPESGPHFTLLQCPDNVECLSETVMLSPSTIQVTKC